MANDLSAKLAQSHAALAEARARTSALEVEKTSAVVENGSLRRLKPLLDQAEDNVRLLTSEVRRVEDELAVATAQARANALAAPPPKADAFTVMLDDGERAAQPTPSPSDLVTPLRQNGSARAGPTPSQGLHAMSSVDSHRRAVNAGLAALKASPAKRPPLDALHLASYKRLDGVPPRTPSSLRKASSLLSSPAPPFTPLGSALLRRP
jgi:hypothetical protein